MEPRAPAPRRSSVMQTLALTNPSLPGPADLLISSGRDPAPSPSVTGGHGPAGTVPSATQHHRAPSLGELHQELEAEQEAAVNRLLAQIRKEQTSLTLQGMPLPGATSPIEEHRQTAIALSRQSSRRSRRSSAASSSAARSPLIEDGPPGSGSGSVFGAGSAAAVRERDEASYYQAETQMLTRENMMLRSRVRELERQLLDAEEEHKKKREKAKETEKEKPKETESK